MIGQMCFSAHTVAEPEVDVGGTRLTPLAQVVSCQLPFGGFVWSWPVAIDVHENGRDRRVNVVDVTRVVQLLFGSIAAAAWLASQIIAIRERRQARG